MSPAVKSHVFQIVLSTFLCCLHTCVSESDNLTDIYMIGLFPLSGAWDGGNAMMPAAEMAVRDINNRSDILPGYRLHLESNDTKCNAGLGVKALADGVCKPPAKIMIIGAACSPVSQAVAQAAQHWNLLQISYVSLSHTLSNKDNYPNFFRLVTSETAFNEARMAIFRHFKWKRVATMHQSFQLFSTMAEDLIHRMKKEGFEIPAQVMFSEDPQSAVRRLKEVDARIIMAGFYRNKARKVFCEAFKLEFYGKHVWLVTGSLAYDDNWWKEDDSEISCTPDQMQLVVQGTLIVDNIYTNPNESDTGLTGVSVTRFKKRFLEETRDRTQPVSGADRAATGYDSVWAAAIALDNTVKRLKAQGSTQDIADFTYQDKDLANMIKEELYKVNFTSASGHVAFDDNGDGQRLIGIQVIKGPELLTAGLFNIASGGLDLIIDDIWNGEVIHDSVRTERVGSPVPLHVYLTMCSLSAGGVLLALLFLAFNIIHRRTKIIMLSSPNINNVILLGCCLAYISVFVEDIRGTNNRSYCMIRITVLIMAFSLAFGSLFAKTWRVHSVFTASLQMKKRSIQDRTLVLMILALVGLNSIVLTVWFLVDMPTIVSEDLPQQKEESSDIIIQYVRHYCTSQHQNKFVSTLLIIQGILLLLGVFLAWETRKVKFSVLNESRHIGVCIYNTVALGVIGVLVSYSLRNNSSLTYVIISCIIILCATVTQCLLFVPKVMAYRKFKKGTLSDLSLSGLTRSGPNPLGMTSSSSQTDDSGSV